jgi:hypothetical protein
MPVDQFYFLTVCSLAFLTVFLLLGVLAIAIRLLTVFFPVTHASDDGFVAAAITSSIAVISPGARVVRIEEIPCSPSPRLERSG